MSWSELLDYDRENIWHPYTSLTEPLPVYPVDSARGVRIKLANGRELVDGMSSWWAAIHGYNHPVMNRAVKRQLDKTSHVMFGGLTHKPAVNLAMKLEKLLPKGLTKFFFSDSGSVSVEVALKMALQYWRSRSRPEKIRFMSLEKGYHGDTFGAMSVCDPVTGMHTLFSGFLPSSIFVPSPESSFGEKCLNRDLEKIDQALKTHGPETAAFILEPVVQGAGGMRIYSPDYLKRVRELCHEHEVLLVADEIATGFGRTGKMFACEYAEISPDVMCLGKALTGGYMSLAATVCTEDIARTICSGSPGVFMHGPTFMGNPLACSAALASLGLLLDMNWKDRVDSIEAQLKKELYPLKNFPGVRDVRVLGAIGVVETTRKVDVRAAQELFVEMGVWIRPFLNLIYIMPPYIIEPQDLSLLTRAMKEALHSINP
ncbi:adenosylmethionine--8-amino-7-oxononanoate transaminase [Desulfonatronovibrio hydrogenovorans]|uniref:adenosylmethionine--8-amino-7-oxononanoate transaminase n=1 Tax=Desulfonatronovibrio hydrogenovorans TaxID=53245 RepID=UPI00048CFB76|nr:adenosylmethionine--8-amino-7-oxononanoate transaminase [Desulfonatronovibrio hydrogenovorans]